MMRIAFRTIVRISVLAILSGRLISSGLFYILFQQEGGNEMYRLALRNNTGLQNCIIKSGEEKGEK
jgi:hypothetical protein